MKAISVRQPWAWAILHAGKPVENRARADGRMPDVCRHRGPLLIHASSWWSGEGVKEAFHDINILLAGTKIDTPPVTLRELRAQTGGIVGMARAVDVILPGGLSQGRVYPSAQAARMRHELAGSPWYTGGYALVLADVVPLPFIRWKGSLGLFEVSDSALPDEVWKELPPDRWLDGRGYGAPEKLTAPLADVARGRR